jgi:hypothetical protein
MYLSLLTVGALCCCRVAAPLRHLWIATVVGSTLHLPVDSVTRFMSSPTYASTHGRHHTSGPCHHRVHVVPLPSCLCIDAAAAPLRRSCGATFPLGIRTIQPPSCIHDYLISIFVFLNANLRCCRCRSRGNIEFQDKDDTPFCFARSILDCSLPLTYFSVSCWNTRLSLNRWVSFRCDVWMNIRP